MSTAHSEPTATATPPIGMPTLLEHADACGVALFAMANPLPKDGSAPDWVTVFPKVGRVETRDDRAFDVSAVTLMAAFREDGISIPVDVNHATDAAGLFGGPAPAVGWGTELREHDGGLQIKVDWLDEGKALLKSRQYLYTSPSFFQDKNRATRLKALALVTSPALARQPALANARGHAAASLKALAVALGLTESANEAECLSAITSLRATAVPKAEHDAVVARLAAIKTGNHRAAVELLIGSAVRQMKISPAERDEYAALCATPAGLAQVERLFSLKTPLMRPSGLDGRRAEDGIEIGETPVELSARAVRYQAEQASRGITLSHSEAMRFVHEHPNAAR